MFRRIGTLPPRTIWLAIGTFVFVLVLMLLLFPDTALQILAIMGLVGLLTLIVAIFALISRALQRKPLRNWSIVALASLIITAVPVIVAIEGQGGAGGGSLEEKEAQQEEKVSPSEAPLPHREDRAGAGGGSLEEKEAQQGAQQRQAQPRREDRAGAGEGSLEEKEAQQEEKVSPSEAPLPRREDRAEDALTPSPLDEVARAMRDSLEQGSVAFNAPEEMAVGDTETIQLLLSPSSSEEELQEQISAPGTTEGTQIQVSNRMQARLTGAGFQVEAISPEEQAIDPAETTEWRWDITPTQAGQQRLHLTLTALIDLEGEETTRQIRSFDRTIDVNVTWGQRLGSIGGFITSQWEWFWTVVLVPIVLLIYRRYEKYTERKNAGGSPRVRRRR